MTKYKVIWEVSKSAIVEAKTEEEAEQMVLEGEVDGEEEELTASPEAYEVKVP